MATADASYANGSCLKQVLEGEFSRQPGTFVIALTQVPERPWIRRRMQRASVSNLIDWGRREVLLLGGLLVAAVLALGFGKIADEVAEDHTKAFDSLIINFFRQSDDPSKLIGPPWAQEVGRDVTSLGGYALLTTFVVIVTGYLLMRRDRGAAVFLLIAVTGGTTISSALKDVFQRARPNIVPHATEVFTSSFPSGHSTLSAVVYLTMAALLTRVEHNSRIRAYIMTVALLLTLMVGVSRVYLGVHWPTDVLAGWSIGSAWAILCWVIAVRLQWIGTVEPPEHGVLEDRESLRVFEDGH